MADGGDLPDLENAQKNGKFGPDSYMPSVATLFW